MRSPRDAGPEVAEKQMPGDPAVGNGKATGWAAFYLARGADEMFALLLAADGERVLRERIDMGMQLPDDMPKTSTKHWQIDSTEALRIARTVSGWPEVGVDNRSFVGFVLGFDPEEDPVWGVVAGSAIDDETAEVGFAAIDARTGEIQESGVEQTRYDMDPTGGMVLDDPASMAPAEAGGTLRSDRTVLQPSDTGAFSIGSGHLMLHARLDMPDHMPLASARATLVSPDGMEHELLFSGGLTQAEPAYIDVPAPAAGEWQVRLTLTRGLVETLELAWCAEGEAAEDRVPECEAMEERMPMPAAPEAPRPAFLPRASPWPELPPLPSSAV